MKSYIDAMMFLTSNTDFSHLDNEELEFLYHCTFGHLAYHISREGLIHFLQEKRDQFAFEKSLMKNL